MGHDIRPTGSLHHKWSNTASSTSDMFLLWWSFNEFGTIGRGDCYNYLDVTSFSRTFNDFTSKLFDGFLFMKYEEFYQDIYNNNISQDNHTEVFTQVMSFPQNPEIRHQPGQSH